MLRLRTPMRTLLSLLFLLVAAPASALDLASSGFDITFHISHPAKEYDARLLDGGGSAELQLEPADFTKSTVDCSIQVVQFNSDNTRRDSHMMEVLEGLIFPTITWSVESITGAAGALTAGTHPYTAAGPLTIKETTKRISVPVEVTVGEDGAISVAASLAVSLEEYGIKRPTLLFVPIADELPIQVQVRFPANPAVFAPPPAPVEEPTAPVEEATAPTDEAAGPPAPEEPPAE